MNNKDTSLRLTVLLGVIIALPAVGTDFYVPALPELARALGMPVSAAQFTLTTYFIGIAAGQLLWGPLSDRYGRKPALLAGLVIMLAASIAGIFMQSAGGLALARLAQGLGMSSGSLIGRTIVRDLHAQEQAARLLARMTIVFSLVPICAPLIGATLVSVAGWPSVLGAMAVVAVVLLASMFALPETAPAQRRSVHPADIARTFASILGDRRFLAPFLVIVCAQIGILAWVSNSAFTLMRGLGVSTMGYGLMFATVMLGQIGGSWAASRLVLPLGIGRLLRLGAVLMLAGGAAGAACAWLGLAHWLAVVLPFMVLLFGTALIIPNAMAAALTPFPQSAGSASSLIGAIGFAAGALVSTALGAIFDGTARPICTVALLSGLGACFFERRLNRGSR